MLRNKVRFLPEGDEAKPFAIGVVIVRRDSAGGNAPQTGERILVRTAAERPIRDTLFVAVPLRTVAVQLIELARLHIPPRIVPP